MADQRKKNGNWFVTDAAGDVHAPVYGRDGRALAVLMDIRDELQAMNKTQSAALVELQSIGGLLRCQNAMDIPRKLERIARNTSKPRRRRKPAAAPGVQG
ncbi:MAG: hypothetical protein WBD40_08850 [Tepidisphaeraceae bacterium]